ncbi:ImmA/IrrE family metallo-endopeptidase [Planctomycetales bacterium ZRK34]|nr:ImmA/IrrE family metallo-endopeptidase [Planctomycetales bacterium ZRK34]
MSIVLEAEAESTANQVVSDHGFKSLPICPFKIARKKEIEIATRDGMEPGVSGFLMRVGNAFGIYHSSRIQNDGFIRFSIAHELGHYFLPGHCDALFMNGNCVHESRSGTFSGNDYERQADFFAAALLMPESLFLPALRNAGSGFHAIGRLQHLCQTSITATAIRYARFAEDPIAVIISEGTSISCSFQSEAFKEIHGTHFFRKGTPVPAGTCTAEFNKDSQKVRRSSKAGAWASLDDWFDDAPQIEIKEDVVGLGSYGKTLTLLFLDDDNSDSLEDDVDDL